MSKKLFKVKLNEKAHGYNTTDVIKHVHDGFRF